MKIDVLPAIGSPRNIIPDYIYNRGVGGSELFIMSLLEKLGKYGYEVNYYNDPPTHGRYGNVNYLPNYAFDPDDPEKIVILFRAYDERIAGKSYKKIIGISTDQYTTGNYANDFYPAVQEMIGISDFHKADHLARYGKIANKMRVLDIGIDSDEYSNSITKDPYQAIFCSVPDRGLDILLDYWPELKLKIPELKLIITSDYRLWGADFPYNEKYKEQSQNLKDVTFLGKIERKELINYQLQSSLMLYPCRYDENFCIACAECEMAGTYPITSSTGALLTTNFTKGKINSSPNDPLFKQQFISKVENYYKVDLKLRENIAKDLKYQAKLRFSWDRIFPEWLKILNE